MKPAPAGYMWTQPDGTGLLVQSIGGRVVEPTLDEGVAQALGGTVWNQLPARPLTSSWTVDTIIEALDQHDLGFFWQSQRLNDRITRDPRILSAREQRVSTPTTLPWRVIAADEYRNGTGAARVAKEAAEEIVGPRSRFVTPETRRRIITDCVDFGFAIAQVVWKSRADGMRVDFRLERWPMAYLTWNAYLGAYQAITAEGLVTIRHGDGHWVVFEPHGFHSWMWGCVRAMGIVWADRTYGIRYRSQHAAVRGSPAPLGKLPPRIPIDSAQGKAFQRLVMSLRDGRPAGVMPEGADIFLLEAKDTAGGEVFKQIVDCADSDVAICYLGQDGTQKKGPIYTPPMLEGVRFDLVELDAGAFDSALNTGVLPIWSVLNFGTVDVCPAFECVLPDPEQDERDEGEAKRHDAVFRILAEARSAGADVDQDMANDLCDRFRVRRFKLAPKPAAAAMPPVAPVLGGQVPGRKRA